MNICYGFHIDASNSNQVTYLRDAVGKTPVSLEHELRITIEKHPEDSTKMANIKRAYFTFNWGSWENAFFIPKPCMLKFDGTVDYYLNPNDYSKKTDGTASNINDESYEGNAMMEWGQNGEKIWYKIVPDSENPSSASVYIANYQEDQDFHDWSFINANGEQIDHFYTPIYNGSIDYENRLRSLSGFAPGKYCLNKNMYEEIIAAELNNPTGKKTWYIEQFADVILIDLLLILISKTVNIHEVFGNGRSCLMLETNDMLSTGTMNNKGMFWGTQKINKNENAIRETNNESSEYDDIDEVDYYGRDNGVKIFGMENWWGNAYKRIAGHIVTYDFIHKYKMTRNIQDGSTANDYNIVTLYGSNQVFNNEGTGYLTGITGEESNNDDNTIEFDTNCFMGKKVSAFNQTTPFSNISYKKPGYRFILREGFGYYGLQTEVYFIYYYIPPYRRANWGLNASLSAKPT